MTIAQVAQFYAPFVGLLGVVFWLGVLSQRVKGLEAIVSELRTDTSETGNSERLVRLETKMEGVLTQLEGVNRNMQGVQRQLGNLATKGSLHDLSRDL